MTLKPRVTPGKIAIALPHWLRDTSYVQGRWLSMKSGLWHPFHVPELVLIAIVSAASRTDFTSFNF